MADEDLLRQHSPYHAHLRSSIVFMALVLGMTMLQISFQFGGRPCTATISRILADYRVQGEVIQPSGMVGQQHRDRKFNDLAWETLVHLVQEEEQDTLQGASHSILVRLLNMLTSSLSPFIAIADKMTAILGTRWSTTCVSRALGEAGFVWKCVTNQAAERDPVKMAAYRELCRINGFTIPSFYF